ncbi:MAG TPA: hypothetical protein PK358_01575 [Spirochaetota bacterium]|nr:hypothetical protein [Spirochaetota bacterium]HPJ33492.1 hypothetical protein [Spirochaetota bacterium]
MKIRLNLPIVLFTIFAAVTPARSAVYEASTLYNSVSRAETVQELYMTRWDVLKEKNFYFDIYGRINWVFDFDVNTYNSGSGEYEATELRLTRTYGSMTFAIPIGGFRKDEEGSDFIVALNTTGFHYGLVKDIEVDRGDAGTESISDYKHSQFFDDIYAVSILYRPYFTFHGGYIINNEYEPKEDGTMSYSDPVESYKKKFFAVELYKVMAFSMNIDEGRPESTKVSVELNQGLGFIMDTKSIYFPAITLGYENTAAYNDELYDPVWVDTYTNKGTSAHYDKDSARLHVYSLKVNQRFARSFTVEGFLGAQYITDEIYTKENNPEKIDVSKAKEWYILLSYDPIAKADEATMKAYTGVSWYWDPAIMIHRNNPEKGNAVYGWIIGCNFDIVHFGGDMKAEYNFSSDLKKLVEAADKWAVEGSLFVRI